MTIAPLTLPDPSAPPDDDGLLICGPPHDFAIGAFHCKPQSSEKSGKMAFYAPPAFQKAPQGELLVLNGCNGKTRGGTGSGTNQHEVPMAPIGHLHEITCHQWCPGPSRVCLCFV